MGLAAIDPISNPEAWDAIQIGSTRSPGVCFLHGFKREQVFDKKKGKGVKGNTLTFVQGPSVEGTIRFILWDNGTLGTGHNHFAEWDLFYPLLKYDPTKQQIQAISIFHPALAAIDATSFVCEELGAPIDAPEYGPGVKEIVVKFCEFYPPSKSTAVSTPTTSQDHGMDKKPSAQDEQQKEIASLLAQAQAP